MIEQIENLLTIMNQIETFCCDHCINRTECYKSDNDCIVSFARIANNMTTDLHEFKYGK